MGDQSVLTFEIRRSSTAPPERLFALLSDAPGWPTWFRALKRVDWEPGATPPVRLMRIGPVTVREAVLSETAPTHHAYSVRSVIPMRDHRADVHLTARPNGGTDIVWSTTFRRAWPGSGRPVRAFLQAGVSRLASALIAHAERT
ncbi:SRPBCC family protein [Sporichthya polymorpha]|uniref:SRPBCC family protein n=1 Tax=Sporichthya polymorpha TaxID=35751 RepID=UPI00048F77C6|nr:SRPBCC family protein [Sporichthya polymorpha]